MANFRQRRRNSGNGGSSSLFFSLGLMEAAGLRPLMWLAAGCCALFFMGAFCLGAGLFCLLVFCSFSRRTALTSALYGRTVQFSGRIRSITTLRGYSQIQLDSGARYHLLFGPLRDSDAPKGRPIAITCLEKTNIIVFYAVEPR